jgi:hypothetical protein
MYYLLHQNFPRCKLDDEQTNLRTLSAIITKDPQYHPVTVSKRAGIPNPDGLPWATELA